MNFLVCVGLLLIVSLYILANVIESAYKGNELGVFLEAYNVESVGEPTEIPFSPYLFAQDACLNPIQSSQEGYEMSGTWDVNQPKISHCYHASQVDRYIPTFCIPGYWQSMSPTKIVQQNPYFGDQTVDEIIYGCCTGSNCYWSECMPDAVLFNIMETIPDKRCFSLGSICKTPIGNGFSKYINSRTCEPISEYEYRCCCSGGEYNVEFCRLKGCMPKDHFNVADFELEKKYSNGLGSLSTFPPSLNKVCISGGICRDTQIPRMIRLDKCKTAENDIHYCCCSEKDCQYTKCGFEIPSNEIRKVLACRPTNFETAWSSDFKNVKIKQKVKCSGHLGNGYRYLCCDYSYLAAELFNWAPTESFGYQPHENPIYGVTKVTCPNLINWYYPNCSVNPIGVSLNCIQAEAKSKGFTTTTTRNPLLDFLAGLESKTIIEDDNICSPHNKPEPCRRTHCYCADGRWCEEKLTAKPYANCF